MRIKLVEESEGLLARVLNIRLKYFLVGTPKRALSSSHNKYCEAGINTGSPRGIVEIYRRFDSKSLNEMCSDEKKRNKIRYEFSSAIKKARKNEMVALIPEIKITEDHREKSVEFLSDMLLHPRINLVAVPIFWNAPLPKVFENIRLFVEACSYADDLWIAPTVMPLLPLELEKLIKEYQKLYDQFTNFLMNYMFIDFSRSNPVSRYDLLRFVLRNTKKLSSEIDSPICLHGVNIKYGKAVHKENVVPAKDLISPYVGIDIIGSNHKPLPLPREYVARKKIKILDVNDYGYWDLNYAFNKKILEPEGSLITLDQLKGLSHNKTWAEVMAKIYNVEKQSLEMPRISKIIVENPSKVNKYLDGKNSLDDRTRKIVKKAYGDVYAQRTLQV